MKTVRIAEAKSHFSEIIDAVHLGEHVIISRGKNGTEIAAIIPIAEWRKLHRASKPEREEFFGSLSQFQVTFSDDWYLSEEEFINL
ncbi:MAG: type II toxin-antitoxin system prevent-host-death family antitoxin [Propionibacteriaceae bacterium]|jgi:prevent-host-death family protein|nr:type II toxin-antitoxin system prevent-host-death family antitoxin [Propionibacteriaceae bacterium]